jgi:hypothetical protein
MFLELMVQDGRSARGERRKEEEGEEEEGK